MYVAPYRKTWLKEGLAFVLFAIISTSVSYSWYYSSTGEKARNISYTEFGIDLPGSYEIHGIDVSKYQQTVEWKAVREMKVNDVQLGFAFIKATQGYDRIDPTYKTNWASAREASIARGAYHFYNPRQNGKTQAKYFIKNVQLEQGDLPPVLDIETISGISTAKLRKELKTWLKTVEDHYKIKPIIYSNAAFYDKYLGKEFDGYPLWVAHYKEPVQPRVSRSWAFWQHSDRGRVNGIAASVDFNVFNGDSTAFKALLLK